MKTLRVVRFGQAAGGGPSPGPISTARTGYRNGTTSGWAARSLFAVGTSLYAVVLDTATSTIRVYKGTGDRVWTEQDSANAPAHAAGATASYGAAMAIGGTTIYVGYRADGVSPNRVYVRAFDTATDTWAASDVAGTFAISSANPDRGINLAVRSDGDILLVYAASSSSNAHAYTRYEGVSWAAQTLIRGLDSNPLSVVMTADADMLQAFRFETAATGLSSNSLSSTNSVGSNRSIDTTTGQQFASFAGYVNDGGTHRIALAYPDSTGELDVAHATNAASPVYTIVGAISPTTVTDPGNMGAAVVAYNNQWHVVWSGDGRGEIHYDHSDDYATPAFGADTTIVSGLAGTDPAVYACATATGVAVLYTDLGGPTVDLVWAAGSP